MLSVPTDTHERAGQLVLKRSQAPQKEPIALPDRNQLLTIQRVKVRLKQPIIERAEGIEQRNDP
jgi:hypothetical protein